MANKWISGAIKHHGQLHRDLGVAEGKKIPRSMILKAAQGNGVVAQRARLALTLEKLHK